MNKVTQLFHTRDELLLGHYTSLENPGLFAFTSSKPFNSAKN